MHAYIHVCMYLCLRRHCTLVCIYLLRCLLRLLPLTLSLLLRPFASSCFLVSFLPHGLLRRHLVEAMYFYVCMFVCVCVHGCACQCVPCICAVSVFVCVRMRTSVCTYLWTCGGVYVRTHACTHVCVSAYMYTRANFRMRDCVDVCRCVVSSMHACMHAMDLMFACMHKLYAREAI